MRGMPEANRHHNVPRSRGGANVSDNLSTLRKARHDLFHAWAANYPPDTLLRLLAMHAGCFPLKRAFPAGALRDIFGMLMDGEWGSLYHPGVVLPSPHSGDGQVLRHLRREKRDVGDITAVLTGQSVLPHKRGFLLGSALAFFHTRFPREAMVGILQESYGSDLSWAKALRDDVRSGLSAILASAAPPLVPEQQKVVDVLQEQEHRIVQKIAALLMRNPSLSVDDNA